MPALTYGLSPIEQLALSKIDLPKKVRDLAPVGKDQRVDFIVHVRGAGPLLVNGTFQIVARWERHSGLVLQNVCKRLALSWRQELQNHAVALQSLDRAPAR